MPVLPMGDTEAPEKEKGWACHPWFGEAEAAYRAEALEGGITDPRLD
jgi:hypothetical protein